jgi:hypothetical protein
VIRRAGYQYCARDGLFISYRVAESRRVAVALLTICGGGRGRKVWSISLSCKAKNGSTGSIQHGRQQPATIGIPAAVMVPTTG